jgi:hypothetical protein
MPPVEIKAKADRAAIAKIVRTCPDAATERNTAGG